MHIYVLVYVYMRIRESIKVWKHIYKNVSRERETVAVSILIGGTILAVLVIALILPVRTVPTPTHAHTHTMTRITTSRHARTHAHTNTLSHTFQPNRNLLHALSHSLEWPFSLISKRALSLTHTHCKALLLSRLQSKF